MSDDESDLAWVFTTATLRQALRLAQAGMDVDELMHEIQLAARDIEVP